MANRLRRYILEPRLLGLNIDDPEVVQVHKSIVTKKPLLRSAYQDFYHVASKEFGDIKANTSNKNKSDLFIELGSGVGFIKEALPYVQTSDVREDANPDLIIDATRMNLPDSSVSGFFAINVFHHLPHPRLFFTELGRTLVEDGVCVLIEPHKGALSRFVHSRVHDDEFFDLAQSDWEQPLATGALSFANQALSDIVFGRDGQVFKDEFGNSLSVNHRGYVANQLRFLASGGLNYRQLLPSSAGGILIALERILMRLGWGRHLSLHQVWVVRKQTG